MINLFLTEYNINIFLHRYQPKLLNLNILAVNVVLSPYNDVYCVRFSSKRLKFYGTINATQSIKRETATRCYNNMVPNEHIIVGGCV